MAIPEQPEFGRRLRAWRRAAGLSQRRLADRLGYDHTFISRIESGHRRPPPTLPARADTLLGAGGELTGVRVPVPGLPEHIVVDEAVLPRLTGSARMPVLGVVCPRHGLSGCPVEAGFRDIAVLDGDRRAAGEALGSSRVALDNLRGRLRPSQVLLTLRLADSYACVGRPDEAVAAAQRVVAEAVGCGTALIAEELRGLRARLAGRWRDAPEVVGFDRRVRELTEVDSRRG
ncbi:helix-turn-helix domain-containing protein [Actinosynnema sp. CA-248983]